MKKIEKIYVSKRKENNLEIIEKVLIQYTDGSGSCFRLPSFYHKLNNKKKEKEKANIITGIFSISIAELISYLAASSSILGTGLVQIGALLNNVMSYSSFSKAIKNNKMRELSDEELKVIKSLKLYFSYFMLTLNIGFGINNLKVNYEDILRDINHITLATTIDLKKLF